MSKGKLSVALLGSWIGLLLFGMGAASANAQVKRHIVAYGGIADRYVPVIAKNADILIVSKISRHQIRRMKKINPGLTILKYHNLIGVYPNNPEWATINAHEHWFASNRMNHRLIQGKYGWYLMNHSNEQWRSYLCDFINRHTPPQFDGVFLDDCWDRYMDKFSKDRNNASNKPKHHFLKRWSANISLLLREIKSAYPKKVFINGPFPEYVRYVDGCMHEDFIHSNTQSDSVFPSSSKFRRTLNRIQDLKKQKKTILLQSGTRGDGTGDSSRIFRLCLASFFLVRNEHTYFNFQPTRGYYFRGIPEYDTSGFHLGPAKNDFCILKKGLMGPNLLCNGNFTRGLTGWRVISGHPCVCKKPKKNNHCIAFVSNGKNGDLITSEYIPVTETVTYTISLHCKSERNEPGTAFYRKLGLLGRYYDKNKNVIPGYYDLMLDQGQYNWNPYEVTHVSPKSAVYFRLSIGFIRDGSGKCRVDDVYFGRTKPCENIIKKDFANGCVIVNSGTKDSFVKISSDMDRLSGNTVQLNSREGRIITWRK